MNSRTPLLGGLIQKLAANHQHLSSRLNRALEPVALNMTQMTLLTYCSRTQETPFSISTLALHLDMNQPMVTKALKPLEQAGLFTRIKDDNDARISLMQITPQGVAQLETAQTVCLPVLEEAFKGFSEEELGVFLGFLSRIE